jgi:hypothetical protein
MQHAAEEALLDHVKYPAGTSTLRASLSTAIAALARNGLTSLKQRVAVLEVAQRIAMLGDTPSHAC